MHYATLFLFATLAMGVHGRTSARTFGSPQHPEHNIHAHPHNHFPGAQHDATHHGVQAGRDSSVSILVCQVVKVPVGHSGAQPSHATTGVGSSSVEAASSVVSSSQEALSSLNSRVRTAVKHIVDPVVAALQNTSLWLNRTSQLHLNQSHQHSALHHEHQHAGMVNHAHAAHNNHEHQHQHGAQVNHHGAQGQVQNHHHHQLPQVVPNQAVPMTVVSVPVLVPAVHVGSVPLVNLSASVPASIDVPSLQFSYPSQENATLSAPVKATAQPTSTPADANLLGRTGDLPTAPVTDITLTQASDVSTPTTLSDIFTIWLRSGTVDDSTEATSTSEPTTSFHGPISTSSTSADASTTGHKPRTTVAL
ncbi:midnolin homolog [Rhipicephalus sanguineus]|uniref:midnolin homolog n=1 Tax=Rhipicephalus sanguineus TaxID=34632 RepID=UPI00189526EE|nr:midnolin homolog [Rhipicephalus sanguineus]